MSYLSRHLEAQEAFMESCKKVINDYQELLSNSEETIDGDKATAMSRKFDEMEGTDKLIILASILDGHARGESLVELIEHYLGEPVARLMS